MQTSTLITHALWYEGPQQAAIRAETLRVKSPEECLVIGLHSAISRGTESLIFNGRVPPSEFQRMRAPFMEGEFPFPVKYGYCHVGLVEQGPSELEGQRVFSLQPHQSALIADPGMLCPLPDALPGARAVLAANMETALNAVWTAKVGPADRVAIVGGGVVGLLVAYLCGQMPGVQVSVIDPFRRRATHCRALGVGYLHPDDRDSIATDALDCDVVFHTSGNPQGLQTALALAGNEAAVIELSWYGDRLVQVPLGQAFHSRQLRLLSCQVGHIEAAHQARWDYRRRLVAALNLLLDERLDCLLEPGISLNDVPAHLHQLFDPDHPALCQVIDYPYRN